MPGQPRSGGSGSGHGGDGNFPCSGWAPCPSKARPPLHIKRDSFAPRTSLQEYRLTQKCPLAPKWYLLRHTEAFLLYQVFSPHTEYLFPHIKRDSFTPRTSPHPKESPHTKIVFTPSHRRVSPLSSVFPHIEYLFLHIKRFFLIEYIPSHQMSTASIKSTSPHTKIVFTPSCRSVSPLSSVFP